MLYGLPFRSLKPATQAPPRPLPSQDQLMSLLLIIHVMVPARRLGQPGSLPLRLWASVSFGWQRLLIALLGMIFADFFASI